MSLENKRKFFRIYQFYNIVIAYYVKILNTLLEYYFLFSINKIEYIYILAL